MVQKYKFDNDSRVNNGWPIHYYLLFVSCWMSSLSGRVHHFRMQSINVNIMTNPYSEIQYPSWNNVWMLGILRLFLLFVADRDDDDAVNKLI